MMANNLTAYEGGYNSFSGVDIKAVFGSEVLTEIQAISYSITREKAPVYTMGSAEPRSFSRGKRGIAGTCIFIMFDRHAVLSHMGIMREDFGAGATKFFADIDDLRPEMRLHNTGEISSAANEGAIVAGAGSQRQIGSAVQDQESLLTSVASDQTASPAWYMDQILPFDITLAAASEYGALAVMRIHGVEFLNEGYGVSVDDIQSAQQATWIARTIVGWRPVPNPQISQLRSQG
jgi:hypothetical protein